MGICCCSLCGALCFSQAQTKTLEIVLICLNSISFILLLFCLIVIKWKELNAADAAFFSIMFIMSIMICVHYADKRERLSSSLPGMIDVNKELVEKALEGDAISQYFIGRKYELEDGAIQNEHTAFAWYALSAEGGCAEAKAKFDD